MPDKRLRNATPFCPVTCLCPRLGHRHGARRLGAVGLALLSVAGLGASPPGPSSVPPEVRAKLLMALLGLVVLGIGLVVVVVLMGRSARRLARDGRSTSRMTNPSWRAPPTDTQVLPPDATPSSDQHGEPRETGRIDETGRTGE